MLIHRPVTRGGIGIPSTAITVEPGYAASTLTVLPLLHKMQAAHMTVPLPVLVDGAWDDACNTTHPMHHVRQYWAHWYLINGDQSHVPGADREASVPAPGGPPAGHDECDTSFARRPFPDAYARAAEGNAPRHLQHILTGINVKCRDDCDDAALLLEATHPTDTTALAAAGHQWTQHGAVSPALRLALLHSKGGRGHAWVLDTGIRRCKNGLPVPAHALHTMTDAPLSNGYMRIGLRARLGLPLGELVSLLREASGQPSGRIQCHCSSTCIKGGKGYDNYGHHLSTMAQGGWSFCWHFADSRGQHLLASVFLCARAPLPVRAEVPRCPLRPCVHAQFGPGHGRGAGRQGAGREIPPLPVPVLHNPTAHDRWHDQCHALSMPARPRTADTTVLGERRVFEGSSPCADAHPLAHTA